MNRPPKWHPEADADVATGAAAAPDQAAQPRLPIVRRRGYDPSAVDAYLRQLDAERARLAARLASAEHRATFFNQQLDQFVRHLEELEPPSFVELGDRAAALLRLAEDEAQKARDAGAREASEIRERATRDAEAIAAAIVREAEELGVQLKELEETHTPVLADHERWESRDAHIADAEPEDPVGLDQLRAIRARRLLNDLDELRAISLAQAQGATQVEIASALGRSQPTVHRQLRRLEADPSLVERRPLEVIAEAVAGLVDRDAMRAELATMDLSVGSSPEDPYADGFVQGAWAEVVEALEDGWLTDGEYEVLAQL